jgi:hypothetical protein
MASRPLPPIILPADFFLNMLPPDSLNFFSYLGANPYESRAIKSYSNFYNK